MIDNFELVKQLISFNEEDKLFFFLQIVRRAKDHKYNNTKVKEGAIKTYFVTSKAYLDSVDACYEMILKLHELKML